MIGWENNQGAYFINKLSDEIDGLSSDVSDIEDSVEGLEDSIETLSDNHVYQAIGSFIKSKTGTTDTYGLAVVHKYGKDGFIEFECKVTTAGTGASTDVYMKPEYITALNSDIPEFKVKGLGSLHYYTSTGSLDTATEGYGGCMTVSQSEQNSWTPARVYNTSAGIGGWQDNKFTANMILQGIVPIEFI